MSWLYDVFSEQAVSNIVGVAEVVVGIALLIGLKSRCVAFYAGAAACVIFITTLSFMFTTPGAFKVVDGVPVVDFFLFKDLAFLGISIGIMERNFAGNCLGNDHSSCMEMS